jgi:hypothetical protein
MATVTFTVTEPAGGIPWIWITVLAVILSALIAFFYLYKKGYIVIER